MLAILVWFSSLLLSSNLFSTESCSISSLFPFSGLKEKTEKKLKDKEDKNKKLSPWEEYRQKKKMKRLEKKETRIVRIPTVNVFTDLNVIVYTIFNKWTMI